MEVILRLIFHKRSSHAYRGTGLFSGRYRLDRAWLFYLEWVLWIQVLMCMDSIPDSEFEKSQEDDLQTRTENRLPKGRFPACLVG